MVVALAFMNLAVFLTLYRKILKPLMHRWYMNVIQRMHAYQWQQHG